MALATVAELASNLTGGLFDAAFPASLLAGVLVGIAVVWVVNRFTRRAAHEQAAELIEVARREAVVGAGELRQKAESEIQEKRAEFTRRIAEYAGKIGPGRWIQGGDWDHENWPGAPLPAW